MTLAERIEAFSILGDKINSISTAELETYSYRAQAENQWFTEENIRRSLEGIAFMLQKEKLEKWLAGYHLNPEVPRIVGIVMAGNIPLVGFHDLMSVLISGHFAAIKASTQDTFLVSLIIQWLLEIDPRFKKNLEIRERLIGVDAVIATGSDNTSRYFEYYFRKIPSIIRKNRTSVAMIEGDETSEELGELGKDIFWYFGLGCRNVSKMFVPKGYDPKLFFESIEHFNYLADHNKYRNNYDYHKSILLINGVKHLDNGFLLWQPSDQLVSPISILYVQEYGQKEEAEAVIDSHSDKIQCVVGKEHIPFGWSQRPEPWDYADNVDSIAFLAGL